MDSTTIVNGRRSDGHCNPCKKSFVVDLYDKAVAKWKSNKVIRNDENDCHEGTKKKIEPDCEEKTKIITPKINETIKTNDECDKEPEKKIIEDKVMIPCREKICVIKEQNPLAPPCCRRRSPPPVCPRDPEVNRAPICGCESCRKNGYHGNRIDRRTFADEPPRLEKA